MPTKIIIIFIINKFYMRKKDCLGICSYYKELPRGKKDVFVREVAEAIGQSSANVYLKLRNSRWGKIEVPIIAAIIEKWEA